MVIRSQKGEMLVTLENGIISENGVQVYFCIHGSSYELGKYASATNPDRERTMNIIKSIYDAKSSGQETFQMP